MIVIIKRQAKKISLIMAALFLIGVSTIALSTTRTYAASNVSSVIGSVNYQLLVTQHPDAAKAQEIMQAEFREAKSNFDTKSATMNDKEKQAYYQQLQQGLQLKEQELLKDINDKVTAAVKAVADHKGFRIVINNGTAVYGGEDITVEVMKKITGK